jgi:lipid II:glycine glycyltransferase (peptidoglycan interpeptide bridge formation enzyme)
LQKNRFDALQEQLNKLKEDLSNERERAQEQLNDLKEDLDNERERAQQAEKLLEDTSAAQAQSLIDANEFIASGVCLSAISFYLYSPYGN